MTSQPGKQRIVVHIFPIISRSKVSQIMKFGQLIEYNKRNMFFRNRAENVAGGLVTGFFLSFKKALQEIKSSGLQLSFNIF